MTLEPQPEPERRYNARLLLVAGVLTVGAIALFTMVFPLTGLVVPVLLLVAGIATALTSGTSEKSVWMGVLIGAALGLVVSAGICISGLSQPLA